MSTTIPTTIDRTSLREQVRTLLRAQVITGQLVPGELYAVADFAKALGVSATPVREALGDLAQLGLVEIVRNRGFIVPVLTDHDLDEIFQVRLMLEVGAVSKIAGKLSEAELANCDDAVHRCRDAAEHGDLAAFLAADRDFHLRLLGALGNERLVEIVDRLRDQTRLYGLLQLAPARLLESAEEHQSLLAAVAEGRRKLACDELARHLEHTRGLWAGHEDAESR
jgi:DNA-binding GntR family transcriptional regulator